MAETQLNADSSRSHTVFNISIYAREGPLAPSSAHMLVDPITGQAAPGYKLHARLSVVDLAGSERASRTKIEGDRLKEAVNINQSLMVLMRCLDVMRENSNATAAASSSVAAASGATAAASAAATAAAAAAAPTAGGSSKLTGGIAASLPPRKLQLVPFRESKLTRLFGDLLSGASSAGSTVMIVNACPSAPDFDETLHAMKYGALAKDIRVHKAGVAAGTAVVSSQYDEQGRRVKPRKEGAAPAAAVAAASHGSDAEGAGGVHPSEAAAAVPAPAAVDGKPKRAGPAPRHPPTAAGAGGAAGVGPSGKLQQQQGRASGAPKESLASSVSSSSLGVGGAKRPSGKAASTSATTATSRSGVSMSSSATAAAARASHGSASTSNSSRHSSASTASTATSGSHHPAAASAAAMASAAAAALPLAPMDEDEDEEMADAELMPVSSVDHDSGDVGAVQQHALAVIEHDEAQQQQEVEEAVSADDAALPSSFSSSSADASGAAALQAYFEGVLVERQAAWEAERAAFATAAEAQKASLIGEIESLEREVNVLEERLEDAEDKATGVETEVRGGG